MASRNVQASTWAQPVRANRVFQPEPPQLAAGQPRYRASLKRIGWVHRRVQAEIACLNVVDSRVELPRRGERIAARTERTTFVTSP